MRSDPLQPPRSPLPGYRPVRALFIKRWGTLLEGPAPSRGLAFDPLRFTPGSVDALYRARQAGWLLYLIGNEEGLSHGRVGDAEWAAFESALLDHLARHGAGVMRSYPCLDHPGGRGPHQRRSVFQLPDTGVFYHAAQHDGVSLEHSWVIGDSTLDLAGGERAGCKVAGVRTGLALQDAQLDVEPTLVGDRLADVLDALSFALRRVAG